MERWLNSRELGAKIVRPAGVVICTFTLVLSFAVLLISVDQFLLLVVVPRVATLDFLLQRTLPSGELWRKASLVDHYVLLADVDACQVENVGCILIVEPLTVVG